MFSNTSHFESPLDLVLVLQAEKQNNQEETEMKREKKIVCTKHPNKLEKSRIRRWSTELGKNIYKNGRRRRRSRTLKILNPIL